MKILQKIPAWPIKNYMVKVDQSLTNQLPTLWKLKFKFLYLAVQKFHFGKAIFWGGGDLPHRGLPNLFQTIVSQTTSYIISFNFLCSAL